VLSDSTEPVDRLEKLLPYRRLPSLHKYALINQNKPWVEVYRRTEQGWTRDIYEAGEIVDLASVELQVSMHDLYADVAFEVNAST
jgi:Uma2 family endonuclease